MDGVSESEERIIFGQVEIDIYNRNYKQAIERLNKADSILVNDQFYFTPKDLMIGLIKIFEGKTEESHKYFNSAVSLIINEMETNPEDPRYYSSLGLAFAGLGIINDAIDRAKKATEMLPVSREALRGQTMVHNLARVYSLAGEYDLAIDLLEGLINLPSEVTPTLLKIDPIWDTLEDNKRFKKLLTTKRSQQ